MGILSNLKLIRKRNKTEKVFEDLFPGKTFWDVEYDKPSEYVSKYWTAYKDKGIVNNSLNGNIFELIISTLFVRENIVPMYLQAKVAFIPNVEYDLVLYNKELGPISISLKTSLRERKKQADLEAIALKYVHRKSQCYLISMETQEVESAKKDLLNGYLLGLDDVILADGEGFNEFIKNLKNKSFTEAGSVEIIKSNQIITSDIIKKYGTDRK